MLWVHQTQCKACIKNEVQIKSMTMHAAVVEKVVEGKINRNDNRELKFADHVLSIASPKPIVICYPQVEFHSF
jgi:hypothetical protein